MIEMKLLLLVFTCFVCNLMFTSAAQNRGRNGSYKPINPKKAKEHLKKNIKIGKHTLPGSNQEDMDETIAILRELRKASAKRHNISEPSEDELNSLFVDDILVDLELAKELKRDAEKKSKNRGKGKGKGGERKKRSFKHRREWYNGQVPFIIDTETYSFDTEQLYKIRAAVQFYNDFTCLNLTEFYSDDPLPNGNFIRVVKEDGCWSSVGSRGRPQSLSLSDGCYSIGTVLHEFGHAIGYHHEQSRADRDFFVYINWDNINPDKAYNFETCDSCKAITNYDFTSIMHYSPTSFKISSGLITIQSYDALRVNNMGYRGFFSFLDLQSINQYYCSYEQGSCTNNGYINPSGNAPSTCNCQDHYGGATCSTRYSSSSNPCGSEFSATDSLQTLTRAPSEWGDGQKCVWFIDADPGHVIEWTIDDVNLFSSSSYPYACKYSYVEIRDRDDVNVGKRFCNKLNFGVGDTFRTKSESIAVILADAPHDSRIPGSSNTFTLSYKQVKIAPNIQPFCTTIGGTLIPDEQTCIKGYSSDDKSWADAFLSCKQKAPAGAVGRLVNVLNQAKYDIVKSYSDYWIGARSYGINSNGEWAASEWLWFDSPDHVSSEMIFSSPAPYIYQYDNDDPDRSNEACLRMKSENYKTEVCSSTENYVCEWYYPDEVRVNAIKTFCDSIGGVYLEEQESCATHNETRITWDEAFAECSSRAPQGAIGRILNIRTEETYNWAKGFGGSWLGLKADNINGVFNVDDWNWYDTSSTPGEPLKKGFYPRSPYVSSTHTGTRCFRMYSSSYRSISCTENREYFCEYTYPKPQLTQSNSVEERCVGNGGIYKEDLHRCYKPHTYTRSWSDAFDYCENTKPVGLNAQLAHADSESKWHVIREYSNYWVGARSENLNLNNDWVPSEWSWYKTSTSAEKGLDLDYYPAIDIDTHNGEACFRSKDYHLDSEDCDKTRQFLCEYYESIEDFCALEGGAWHASLGICLVEYSEEETWHEAFDQCVKRATPLTFQGRLAHADTEERWNIIQNYNDVWIGARSQTLNSASSWVPSEWYWYDHTEGPVKSLEEGYTPSGNITIYSGYDGNACFRSKDYRFKSQTCDYTKHFLCEYRETPEVPKQLNIFCDAVGGTYSGYLERCYLQVNDAKQWYDAFEMCSAKAPPGLIGRLAHADTEERWNIIKFFNDVWIGARVENINSNFEWIPSEWYWYDDADTPSSKSLNHGFTPSYTLYEDSSYLTDGDACFRSKDEKFKSWECDSSKKFLCEFFEN